MPMIDAQDAAMALAFTVGWEGGVIPVFVDGRPAAQFSVACSPGAGSMLWRKARALDDLRSSEVTIGLPLADGYVRGSTVLWAWVRGTEQVTRARTFRPAPTTVLKMGAGSERLLIWGLSECLAYPSVQPANERLSYALHGARTMCEPEKLRIPLPGTFLRHGRARPAAVTCQKLIGGWLSRRQVVGELKDAPSKTAWRERKVSGR